MGKPHPIALRERVVAFVNEGNSHCEAARYFRVSPRFVNNMMIPYRSCSSLAAVHSRRLIWRAVDDTRCFPIGRIYGTFCPRVRSGMRKL